MNLLLAEKERLSELNLENNNFIISVSKDLCPVCIPLCFKHNHKCLSFFLFCFHVLDWLRSNLSLDIFL